MKKPIIIRQSGVKVVCIDDRFHPYVQEWGDQLPRRGQIYTIELVLWCRDMAGVYGVGYILSELKNPGDRLAFSERRFQSLEESLEK